MTLSFGSCTTVKAISLSASVLWNHMLCTEDLCSKCSVLTRHEWRIGEKLLINAARSNLQ